MEMLLELGPVSTEKGYFHRLHTGWDYLYNILDMMHLRIIEQICVSWS